MTRTEIIARARKIYQERLKSILEDAHRNAFVAIDPVSGEYFLGRTLSEAASAANDIHPERRFCVLRVGHDVTVEIGATAS